MNLAPHILELEAAQRGTHDVYGWFDMSGRLVDTAVTFVGEPIEDQGHSGRLSEKLGCVVRFGGRLSVEDVEIQLSSKGES